MLYTYGTLSLSLSPLDAAAGQPVCFLPWAENYEPLSLSRFHVNASWYFLPVHRAYLDIIRRALKYAIDYALNNFLCSPVTCAVFYKLMRCYTEYSVLDITEREMSTKIE